LVRSFLILSLFAAAAHAQSPADDLSIAIASDDPAKAQAALAAGAKLDADYGRGHTPLIAAVILTKPAMVRFLLEHGADPNHEADDGAIGNALSACFFASPGMAILRRAEPDFVAERRGPAIESLRAIAAKRPNADILVSRGPTRMSPLMIAAESGAADAVKILLEAGASPNFANGGKYTALDYAVDRVPPFMQIPEADRVETVRLLLAAGARKDKKGADGLTPLDRARKAVNAWAVAALSN
jgi:ankyrin repeat protein